MTIDRPTAGQTGQLRKLWQEAFGDTDAFLDVFWATAFCAEHCRCVTIDGTLAAALYWFDCEYRGRKVAYLYAVATAKAFRGRGLCRALMENTHAYLEDRGYAASLLVPQSGGLRQMYEAMGYRAATSVRELCCAPENKAADIFRIDKAEYARLRRELLPEDGVIQEKENLDFLQIQAKLYAGPGFLLAARGEGDTLHALELLGDVSAAPGILQALGYSRGEFRTAGQGKPFAMYRPLGKSDLPAPGYFGLAFD